VTQQIVFAVAALSALVAGVSMVLARNAVHAALFLVGTQIALAVLFLLQGAFFIAALQVIIYAGAIMVLFIFVIMLLGVDREEVLSEPLPMQRVIAVGLGIILVGEALYLGMTKAFQKVAAAPVDAALPGEGNVEAVARALFTRWAFPFELTSVLLTVAIVAVMLLAKKRLD